MLLKYVHNGDLFLLTIFNHRIKCKVLDWLMPAITYLGSFTFVIIYCLSTLLYPNERIRSLGVRVTLALSLATTISQIIKISVSRLRPFIKIQNLNIRKIGIDKYSFPSGHTTAAFSVAITTALIFPSVLLAGVGLATLVGISRMYLGVHYPSDVAAGVLIGSFCSTIIHIL
jgi:undecaprenyl-diphosphatase